MLARLAARLFLAPLGLVCGLLAGMFMLAMMSADQFTQIAEFPEEVLLFGYDMSINSATLAFLFAPLMGAPAIVAVLIGEMFSIRSWVYYAAAGAMTAGLPWWCTPAGMDGAMFTGPQILACGFVGGLVHWLIAGRNAGFDAAEPPPPPAA